MKKILMTVYVHDGYGVWDGAGDQLHLRDRRTSSDYSLIVLR